MDEELEQRIKEAPKSIDGKFKMSQRFKTRKWIKEIHSKLEHAIFVGDESAISESLKELKRFRGKLNNMLKLEVDDYTKNSLKPGEKFQKEGAILIDHYFNVVFRIMDECTGTQEKEIMWDLQNVSDYHISLLGQRISTQVYGTKFLTINGCFESHEVNSDFDFEDYKDRIPMNKNSVENMSCYDLFFKGFVKGDELKDIIAITKSAISEKSIKIESDIILGKKKRDPQNRDYWEISDYSYLFKDGVQIKGDFLELIFKEDKDSVIEGIRNMNQDYAALDHYYNKRANFKMDPRRRKIR